MDLMSKGIPKLCPGQDVSTEFREIQLWKAMRVSIDSHLIDERLKSRSSGRVGVVVVNIGSWMDGTGL